MLLGKVSLLESKLANLEQINNNWSKVDSLRSTQITRYRKELQDKNKKLERLTKGNKTLKIVAGSSILTTIVLAIVCVLK